jgi:hypothetical protein
MCLCREQFFSLVTEEKSALSEVRDWYYCLDLFIIFGPPHVIPRIIAELMLSGQT